MPDLAPVSWVPEPLSSLIGRERDLAFVFHLIRQDQKRLVTLTGPGGVGKTRLAQAVALRLEPVLDDGVVFLRQVQVDPDHSTALAGRGAQLADFSRETGVFGLAMTGGVVFTTGVAGFTLGGGGGGWLAPTAWRVTTCCRQFLQPLTVT